MDHVGPFVKSRRGNAYILVIVDAFTKFVIIEAVKDTRARYVIKTLLNFMYVFGSPTRVITDRGTAFTSRTFKLFCDNYGVKHTLNAVATPRSNGQCERYNRTILNALAVTAAGNPEDRWDEHVKSIQCAINCTVTKSTGVSPLEALAGYKPRHVAESYILNEVQGNLGRADIRALRRTISERISEDQKLQKERFDKTRAEATKYEEGQLVCINYTPPATGGSKKLLPTFKGPFRVIKVLPNDRYELEDLREGRKKRRSVAAVDSMKPWIVLRG
nr:unnamed protein product [Callosobruchus analis]